MFDLRTILDHRMRKKIWAAVTAILILYILPWTQPFMKSWLDKQIVAGLTLGMVVAAISAYFLWYLYRELTGM